MLKFGKIISIVLIFALVSCSSQKIFIKEMGYSIKDVKGDIVFLSLVDGRTYNFTDNMRYSYLLKENSIVIKKNYQIIEEIKFKDIAEYSIKESIKVSSNFTNFLLGIAVGAVLFPLVIGAIISLK